jgi:hypothetical protein
VIALALMTGWIRSLFVFDSVNVHVGATNWISIESKRQSLSATWSQDPFDRDAPLPFWSTRAPSLGGTELPDDYRFGPVGLLINLGEPYPRGIILTGPYWAVTVPLALLSAYLILWKPKPRA